MKQVAQMQDDRPHKGQGHVKRTQLRNRSSVNRRAQAGRGAGAWANRLARCAFCSNVKRRHVVYSARFLLKGRVTSREMMHHLRSSLSDDDFVDVVSDDLPVVFRFNQAFDVLEEATP